MEYKVGKELVLFNISEDEEYSVPEIKITFESKGKSTKIIASSLDAADFVRSIFDKESLEVQEQFFVLYLDSSNKVIGYYRHSVGTINSVTVDTKHIIAAGLKSLCVNVIIAHNHPSGSTKPSEADISLTKGLKSSFALMNIILLDHVIVTTTSYYSFADDTQMLSGIKLPIPIEVTLRARLFLIENLISKIKDKESADAKLLRNGIITKEVLKEVGYENEEKALQIIIEKEKIESYTLSFYELSRLNTFFHLHPEKVAGEEILTSSREFPVSITGTKERIIETIEIGLPSNQRTNKVMKASAKEIREKLMLLDGTKEDWFATFSGLDGTDVIETLGELGEFIKQEISSNDIIVENILRKAEQGKKYSSSDTLSFEEVVKLYNNGISEDEIRAWVWYKRTLGFPMQGWDKYYLPNTGETQDQLYSTKETVIKDNHLRNVNKVRAGVLLGKPTKFKNEYDGTNFIIYTGTDGNKYYASEKDTEIKKATFKTDQKLLDDLVKKGVLLYLSGELVPYPVYVFGNIYDRELTLQKDKETILEKYGEKVFSFHEEAIQKGKPKLISITNPDPKERPRILAIGGFAKSFTIKELRIETGIELLSYASDSVNLPGAFKLWLKSLDSSSFKEVTSYDIIYYYLEGHNLTKRLSDEEKEQVEKYAPIEGEELFSRFLYEALTFEDQQRIDFTWNREFNGQSSVQHHKIPVGFTCSALFKNSVLEFTPAQREAIAFMEAVGSGVIAYDVGVGKTMSAIITLANSMYQGKCKNPMIVVPNPTYKKWVREIIGYTDEKSGVFIPGVLSSTGVQVNEWYNLGSDVLKKIDVNKKIAANTITVLTYEGFAKIGYSEKVMNLLFDQLAAILSQTRDGDKSERDLEKKYQTFREIIGAGLKDTLVDIDALGIDYIVIDEAHNFKNIFSDVKSDEGGVKRFHLHGAQSARGIKAFFLCNYIQRTFGQNVMLLTATPFTNSPLEIYSMLSLVAYKSMTGMGITNLTCFMETFVQQTLEYAPNYKDEIITTPVIKSFNNRLVLQKLIYNHINYKTGEEAGVKRPCKINLPRLNAITTDGSTRRLSGEDQILTYLAMTPIQRANQEEIVDLAKSGTGRNKNIIVALGQSLDNALSPFLYKHSLPPEDYLDFVESSPKIKYALDCIRSVKEYHENKNEPVSGQIIYANRGKDFFPMIKEYLEKEIGYKSKVKLNKSTLDEVEIISSGISQDKKETIKEAFLEGVVKIIIGTATIREGIDLQKKCANIYNLYPEWNPTDIKQLEGRAWRQGNEFGYVRVTMPLVENSMDVFVFQKLDEKMHRINDIWFKGDRGNVLDIESLDPEEVKFALFTNLSALAKLQLDRELKDVTRRLVIIESQIDTLKRIDFKIKKFFEYQVKCIERLLDLQLKYKEYFLSEPKKFSDEGWWKVKSDKDKKEFIEKVRKAIDETEIFLGSSAQEDKEILRLSRQLNYLIKDSGIRDHSEDVFSEFKAYLSEVRKAEKTILEQKRYTINDNFEDITKAFENDKANILLERDKVTSEEYKSEVLQEIIKKKEKLSIKGKTIEERVKDFAKLNYLLDYKASEVQSGNCVLPDLKQRPSVKRIGSETENDKRLIIARAKAKAIRIKLELLNLD